MRLSIISSAFFSGVATAMLMDGGTGWLVWLCLGVNLLALALALQAERVK